MATATPAFVAAQTSPGDAAAQQLEQLQRRQQEQIQRDLESTRRVAPPGGADLRATPAPVQPAAVPGACHDIREIVIHNSPRLRQAARAEIDSRFAGHCLGVNEITEILGLITKDYIVQGYVTSRAYLPAQDLKQGTLTIDVVEGTIEHFRIDDEGKKSVPAGAVFPTHEGQVLNLRDLEQGIDQINRLQSNNARLEILPGEAAGGSVVTVHNTPTRSVHLITSYDNQGQEGTGVHQASATVVLDNLAGLGEQVSVSHRESVPFPDGDHHTQSDGLDLWLPHGYDTWTASVIRSTYRNVLTLPSGTQQPAEGSNSIVTVGYDRVVHRDEVGRLSLGTALTTKDATNFFAGQLLDVSSRKLTLLDVRGSYSRVVLGTGLLNASLDVVQGLKTFGALRDPELLTSEQPHAQFSKLQAGAQLHLPFEGLGQRWSYDGEIAAQKAYDSLYGSEKMLIGSFYTVRGFYNSSLSGDNGFYWRNSLSLLRQFRAGNDTVAARAYAALDFGRVSNVGPEDGGNLSGAAVGLQLQWRALTWDVFYAAPISKPASLAREPGQTWFRLSAAL
ncbi:ShlB/FhaC/HecB family hemolysin secretion/activation protein [Ramlibacter sp.]|uniref:ShlB/FhaC/HecB family hemolysin secretion/activation protein n=1 Tax=Ramlibacter sp. TaxID=1917967 RepID=UPI0026069011|nr:ShlB/FhaC/HecB family hemolysin secretion/activation protein [Ramlibacter sp.]MDB5954061.1 ShlB/FhaC/HecB family hemolysin secretion/activation protein [Ramlibacter sp.]